MYTPRVCRRGMTITSAVLLGLFLSTECTYGQQHHTRDHTQTSTKSSRWAQEHSVIAAQADAWFENYGFHDGEIPITKKRFTEQDTLEQGEVRSPAAVGGQNLAHTERSFYGNTIAWERAKQPRVLHSEMGTRVPRLHQGVQSTAGQSSRLPAPSPFALGGRTGRSAGFGPAGLYSALQKPEKFLQRLALAATRESRQSGPDDLSFRARS
jgi:hypothetical protein